jgi:methylenetetrahydrofolate reductase (NADPH)
MAGKAAALEQRGLAGSVVTQFGFDPGLALAWLTGVRARGISLPVRVGVPGPASVRLLLWYASRCGVAVSAPAARTTGSRWPALGHGRARPVHPGAGVRL